ncbi:hypothetical protein [Kitasatospora fiedleri]|uniref:hypothetical protein n=1 Tax=Kitasatospora fiedleri TaxID=2991545 RepID=UPI00249CE5D5|nr:hypothetical protein [Kitasatospora fiedleri]
MELDKALPEEELSAIERYVAGATPGPWGGWVESWHGIGGTSFIQLRADAEEGDGDLPDSRAGDHKVVGEDTRADADIEFIANARQDVPRPVNEIRRLWAVLEEAHTAE